MFKKSTFYYSTTRWLSLCALCFALMASSHLVAQQDLTGREDPSFRLNLLRTEVVSPNGQQPPYAWSATYLRDNNSNIQPDAGFVLDSSVCGYGIPDTKQFGEEVKVYYHYDNEGFLTEIIYEQETAAPDVYENFSRKTYTYSGGNRTGYLYQLWNSSTSSWEDDYEEKTTFNSDGRQESFMVRETNQAGQWNNLFRETRIYNTDGKPIEILAATWHNNDWLDTARKEVSYNSIGFYTDIYDEMWNGSGWDTMSHESALYDNLGMIWEGYLFRENTANGFQNFVRESYQYDLYGFWTGMNRQVWDENNNQWLDDIRETYLYNRTGIWVGWSQEVATNSGWVDNIRQRFQISGMIKEDQMQTWDTTSGMWNNSFRALAAYDSDKNLVREAGIQKWDNGSSDWTNASQTRQCNHSWSPVDATNTSPKLPDLSCTLANPYRVYEPISCEALQPGKKYDLRLMDMQGRTVYQKTISGGNTLSVDRSLPTGIYHLSIFENQQRRFLRKIVINR